MTHLCNSPPLIRCGTRWPELLCQEIWGSCFHQLFQNSPHDIQGPVAPGHVEAEPDRLESGADLTVVKLTGSGHYSRILRSLVRILSLEEVQMVDYYYLLIIYYYYYYYFSFPQKSIKKFSLVRMKYEINSSENHFYSSENSFKIQ